ncbi:MAG: GDSL-type esterase/lipase family protein [Pseudolysinimonas sp.]
MSRVAIALAQVFSARKLDSGKQNRRSQFAALTPPPGHTLFLGDSITEGAEWAEWFPELATLNRGINGDTVRGVLGRLDTAVNSPTAISLLIGTNDIGGIGESADPDRIADATHDLVRALKVAAPGIPIILTSVMPRSASFARRITRLNARNRAMAETEGVAYVDVWAALVDERGEIRTAFSHDRLHLTGEGYRIWVDALRPHLM